MESRVKLLGHPIHQMLIVFPVGLLVTSVIFDIMFLVSGNALMANVSFWMLVAGIVGGLVAAPFGTADWLAIPKGTRAKKIGALHGGGNVVVLLLFTLSWWLRHDAPQHPTSLAMLASLLGVGLASVTAWLGGELVDRLGVGISDRAHLDAPSSLQMQNMTEATRH